MITSILVLVGAVFLAALAYGLLSSFAAGMAPGQVGIDEGKQALNWIKVGGWGFVAVVVVGIARWRGWL